MSELAVSAFSRADGMRANKLLRRRHAEDLAFLAFDLLPEHFDRDRSMSDFHRELEEILKLTCASDEAEHTAVAGPRGGAKSTWVMLVLPLACILHPAVYRKRYLMMVADTASQAEEHLATLKRELETNERILELYGDLTSTVVWRQDMIRTSSSVTVRALGARKKVRGRKVGADRPDLILVDDVENDEGVQSPIQRRKLRKWFEAALMGAGDPKTGLDIIVVGTILHEQSLLRWLTTTAPGWRRRTYRAVISWPVAVELWEDWAEIYRGLGPDDDDAKHRARAFYAANTDEMNEGAEVLWPEGDGLYENQVFKVENGTAAHSAEKQQDPRDPETALIPIGSIVHWGEPGDPHEFQPHLERPSVALDPSLGKKRGDWAAIVGGGLAEASVLVVVEAELVRLGPRALSSRCVDVAQRFGATTIRVEETAFQEVLGDLIREEVARRQLAILVVGWKPHTNKQLRLQGLEAPVTSGGIQTHRRHVELNRQLEALRQDGSSVDYDDGPDALHALWDFLCRTVPAGHFEARHATKDDETVRRRTDPEGLSADDELPWNREM